MFYRVIWLALLFCACTLSASAQNVPKAEVFGGFSLATTGVIDIGAGWNASLNGNVNSWFGITADFSGHYGHETSIPGGPRLNQSHHAFLFGPRFTHRSSSKCSVFAHGLFGGVRGRAESASIAATETAFGAALGGGVDVGFNDRVALRVVQVDYLLTRFKEGNGIACIALVGVPCPSPVTRTQGNARISFGVVFRLGSR